MDKLLWIAPLVICILMHVWMTRGEHGRTMKNHGGHGKTKEDEKK